MNRIIVALGGNALGNNPTEQKDNIAKALKSLLPIIRSDNQIVITHGNGPQVGMISKAFEDEDVKMPLQESIAMSEGYIGYHIETILKDLLKNNSINKNVTCILTEVEVSKDDKAFLNPTKPIGKFYNEEEAIELSKIDGGKYFNDANKGFRKYVASPQPIDIKQKDIINELLKDNYIVIACGGGGIPVFSDSNDICEAVIDKDSASAKLGELINADTLVIVTDVPYAQLNFGTDSASNLINVTTTELKQYITEGHFKVGSMLSKIEAAIAFIDSGENRKTIITSLENISLISENNCTTITK